MKNTREGYVVSVETADGLRYIGDESAILRAKLDATIYDQFVAANEKVHQMQRMFPGMAFGLELAYTAEEAFQKENGGLV